jgi:hypothetical protein
MKRVDSILEAPILPHAADATEMSGFLLAAVKYLLDAQSLNLAPGSGGAGALVVKRQEIIDLAREQAFFSNERLNSPLLERCLLDLLASQALIQTPQGVRLPFSENKK